MPVAERTVIANAMTPSGSLLLGCRPGDRPPRDVDGMIELYMFRVWSDLDDHALCEDGSVIGWDSGLWGVTSSRARQRDNSLACGERFGMRQNTVFFFLNLRLILGFGPFHYFATSRRRPHPFSCYCGINVTTNSCCMILCTSTSIQCSVRSCL